MPKILSWSFSSMNDFYNCPRAYQLKRVTKELRHIETQELQDGKIVHKHLELRLKDRTQLPDHLQWLEPSMQAIESSGGKISTEEQIALTQDLQICEWFSKEAWVRVVVDLGVRKGDKTVQLDYKTGKRKFDTDQLKLFAGVEFATNPEVEEVRTGYLWLKDKKIDKETYTRKDETEIWQYFLPKVKRMEEAHINNEWPERPSGLCGWCGATKKQCKYAKG